MATTFTSRTGTHPEEGVKAPVIVSTNANITLAGQQTIRGVPVIIGDRVLAKDQTNAADNGIYIVQSGSWDRAPDWNEAQDIASGVIIVDDTNDEVWKATFEGEFVVGVSEVTFEGTFTPGIPAPGSVDTSQLVDQSVTLSKLERFAAAYIIVGKGSSNNPVVVPISGDMTIDEDGVVTIGALKITSAKLGNNAVNMSKLQQIGDGYIIVGRGSGNNPVAVAVSGDITLSNDGVVTIANGVVTAVHLASDSVTTVKILDNNVTETKLAPEVRSKLNASSLTYNMKSGFVLTPSVRLLTIGNGVCSDITESVFINFPATIQYYFDVAIGSSESGITGMKPASVSIAIDTWYRVFAISKADGSDTVIVIDTSSVASNARTDLGVTYTKYRRIGWVRTNASSELVSFNQFGNNNFVLSTPVGINNIELFNVRTAITVLVPPLSIAQCKIAMRSIVAQERQVILSSYLQDDVAPSTSLFDAYSWSSAASDQIAAETIGYREVKANSSSQVYYRNNMNSSADGMNILTVGWIDHYED